MLDRRSRGRLLQVVSARIGRYFSLNLLGLHHAPNIINILAVVVVVLLLRTNDHRLAVMLAGLDISLELLLGGVAVDGVGFEILGHLRGHVLGRVLDVYFSLLFVDGRGQGRLQGLHRLPLVTLHGDVLVAHGSKIIYI